MRHSEGSSMSEEITRSLGRIEGRLEGIENEQRRIADYAIKTSERVGTLEVTQAHSKGWAAGIGAAFGAIGSMLVPMLKGMILNK
jgi:hypothetical protein